MRARSIEQACHSRQGAESNSVGADGIRPSFHGGTRAVYAPLAGRVRYLDQPKRRQSRWD
jgi:hypothetical protein